MKGGLVDTPEVVIKQLADALEAALEMPLASLHIDDLGDWICRVEGPLSAMMAALKTKTVAAADAAGLAPRNGVRATDQYVAARTMGDPAQVRADGRIGRWLHDFPTLTAAFEAGKMSRDHVDHLRRADTLRIHHHMIDAQEYFVAIAAELDWIDFQRSFGYWYNTIDPDGERPKEQVATRFLRITRQPDGSYTGTFRLDPIAGQAVDTAVILETNRLYDEDTETGGNQRTAGQRRADALAGIITRGAKRNPAAPLPRPLVHVTVGKKTFEHMIGAALGDTAASIPVDAHDPDYRCEAADGTPLHPHLAMAVVAVAEFRRLVLEPGSRMLDFGDEARTLPKDIRLALFSAYRGRCRTAGCDAPYAWLQADHVTPYTKHGPTSTDNNEPLCRPDNHWKGDR